ncbi:hypothetical protein JW930_02905 [Candidatus Woesearchaeota archaeon]|nr:hypothetical protein [Candidatus Woesearchaeota archaeon]
MNPKKEFHRMESFLKRLEQGELKLEHEEYEELRQEANAIQVLLKKYPRLTVQLEQIKKEILIFLQVLEKLILVIEHEIFLTDEDIENYQFIPQDLCQILSEIYELNQEEFFKMENILESVSHTYDKLLMLKELSNEEPYKRIVKMFQVIMTNLQKVIDKIKIEKRVLYESSLEN